ncbi:MAG TPA: metallophosphoesterase, partial [Tepidisphaeraceae bacterium]|nr:metallophosphoesterase [Tepidisphaeraceae bacterium]
YAYDERFAAIGDYGRTSDFARGTAHLITSWSPDFVITQGDNNYDDGSADTIDANVGQFYHWFIGNYHGDFGGGPRSNHFFPSIGNHDWTPQGSIAPYKDYFTLPGNERYYDFVQGNIHYFVLDSDPHEPDGRDSNSNQAKWLHSTLTASTSLYNVVYFHHSPFSSGEHGDSSWMKWPFKEWGADVVLSGHDHAYERLIEGGLTYVVNGAGAGPTQFGGNFRAGSVAHNDTDSGALLIQANDIAMTFEYQLRSGVIADAFTIPASA